MVLVACPPAILADLHRIKLLHMLMLAAEQLATVRRRHTSHPQWTTAGRRNISRQFTRHHHHPPGTHRQGQGHSNHWDHHDNREDHHPRNWWTQHEDGTAGRECYMYRMQDCAL